MALRLVWGGWLLVCLTMVASAATYRATIYRDSFGVPHIVADSLREAAFGDGYAQAEDRLELLMSNVQAATGTRAAVLGPRFVEQDYVSRLTGARRLAEEGWKHLAPEARELLEAFAAGVNQFMREHPDRLPPNARPVRPQDILALVRYIGLVRQFQQARQDRRRRGAVPIPGEGSNGWVLAPFRTVEGHPIVLTDPHTPWSGINRWYEKHYLTPQVNIYGASTTGIPLFIFGATSHVAWTLTRNTGDRGDCFVVPIRPEHPDQYRFDGRWVEFKRVEETIEVRNAPAVKRIIYETVHGPVFERRGRWAYAAGMSLYTPNLSLRAFLLMALARDIKAFKQALALCEADGANVIAADAQGNIFYGWMNRLMVRNERYNWQAPVDGSTSATLYRGLVPFERLPQSTNDSGGYYQASNTADWMLQGGAWGIRPEAFPVWLRGFAQPRRYFPARPQRVVDLIRSRPRHSLEQVREMALDTRVLAAEWTLPLLERAVREFGDGGRPEVREALGILQAWVAEGPRATLTSRGYSIFRELCEQTGRGTLANLPNMVGPPEQVDQVPRSALRRLHRAFLQAVARMVKLYGTVSVEWGRINVIELADGRQFPCGAGDATTQTVWQGSQTRRGEDGKWRVEGGSDFMMATLLSDPPVIYTLVPYGQSDDPTSPHFADQTERWIRGQWKRCWFTLEEVRDHAEARRVVRGEGP